MGKEGHAVDHIYETVQPPVLLTLEERNREAQSGVAGEDWVGIL